MPDGGDHGRGRQPLRSSGGATSLRFAPVIRHTRKMATVNMNLNYTLTLVLLPDEADVLLKDLVRLLSADSVPVTVLTKDYGDHETTVSIKRKGSWWSTDTRMSSLAALLETHGN